jgi:hypothetical protein
MQPFVCLEQINFICYLFESYRVYDARKHCDIGNNREMGYAKDIHNRGSPTQQCFSGGTTT